MKAASAHQQVARVHVGVERLGAQHRRAPHWGKINEWRQFVGQRSGQTARRQALRQAQPPASSRACQGRRQGGVAGKAGAAICKFTCMPRQRPRFFTYTHKANIHTPTVECADQHCLGVARGDAPHRVQICEGHAAQPLKHQDTACSFACGVCALVGVCACLHVKAQTPCRKHKLPCERSTLKGSLTVGCRTACI